MHLKETKINRFNQQLADCQRTVGLVLGSINLSVAAFLILLKVSN